MIIATRILTARTEAGDVDIPIRIFAPQPLAIDYKCRFEIDWPNGRVERWAEGVDAVQALVCALQMIGAQLYGSELHENGQLFYHHPGKGYGFPVIGSIRDLLVGDDAKYL
jgi:hypothetical protein